MLFTELSYKVKIGNVFFMIVAIDLSLWKGIVIFLVTGGSKDVEKTILKIQNMCVFLVIVVDKRLG